MAGRGGGGGRRRQEQVRFPVYINLLGLFQSSYFLLFVVFHPVSLVRCCCGETDRQTMEEAGEEVGRGEIEGEV